MSGWRWALIHVVPIVVAVVAASVPWIVRWWRQRRCAHAALAMAPSGRALCLNCWKAGSSRLLLEDAVAQARRGRR